MRISDWSSDVCSSDLSTGIDERCIIMISSGKYGGNRLCHFARVRIVEHAMSRFQPQVPAEAILTAQFIAQAEHQSPIVEIGGNQARLRRDAFRSEKRRVGEGCVRPCRFRWSAVTN